MITEYLLVLGIGHVLGDFYFQTESLARKKKEKYKGVLLHGIEYLAAMLLVALCVFRLEMVIAAIVASVLHFAIDSLKYVAVTNKKKTRADFVFLVDQLAHLLSLFFLAYGMKELSWQIQCVGVIKDMLSTLGTEPIAVARWILAILLIHKPSNIGIQLFLGEYKPKEEKDLIKADNKVGRRIGSTERLIMLIFLSLNQYSALGLVLTAKSIARYDRISKDQKFAEYYLLGTLVSTLLVILCKVFVL